jgi:monoamine oxidase
VRHDAASIEISVEDGAGRHQVRGDRLILTLPVPLLRKVGFTPPLSQHRQRAIREIGTTPMTIVHMQSRERFWDTDGNDGTAHTDLPIQSIYHSTITQGGKRGILQAVTYGPRAKRLAAMASDEQLRFVVAESAKVHPRLAEYFEGGTSYSWTNDPWSLGGHTFFKPGQIREFFPHLQQPEGRIHFAGDWVGGIPGYLHGAVLSAHSVVRSIQGT